MFCRFHFACVTWLAISPIIAAPATAAKPAKKQATVEKKKEPATDSHKVKRGDTLWGLARLHGVSVGDIMDLNRLTDSELHDGQVLKIPQPASDLALAPSKNTTHVVAKGETMRVIARKYGLTQEDLERANPKVNATALKTGSKLIIPATVRAVEKNESDTGKSKPTGTAHTVTETDTYYIIAKKYGSTEAEIAAANPGVNPYRLRPGIKLNIPAHPSPVRKDDEQSATIAKSNTSTGNAAKKYTGITVAEEIEDSVIPEVEEKPKTRRYIVSADETPQTISEAFNIPEKQLYEMNGLLPGTPMKAGQEIQVPTFPGKTP